MNKEELIECLEERIALADILGNIPTKRLLVKEKEKLEKELSDEKNDQTMAL